MYLTDRVLLDIEELNVKYKKTNPFSFKERKIIHEEIERLNRYLIEVAAIEMYCSEISVN